MPIHEKLEVVKIIATTGFAVEGIAVGLLGLLFTVFSNYAPGNDEGQRLEIVRKMRVMALFVVGFIFVTAATTVGAVWWLLDQHDWLFVAVLVVFVIEVVVAIPAGAVAIFKKFGH